MTGDRPPLRPGPSAGHRRPPRLYPIADAEALATVGWGLAQGALAFLEAGLPWVQLRAKSLSSERFHEEADEVARHRPPASTVLVNDRVDLALAAGLDGVHLGQGDLDPREARRLLGPEAVIGWSTHDLSQGLGSRRLPVDYVAVGPVAATTSKAHPDPTIPPWLPAALRGALDRPLVAIGGITPRRARRILGRGVAGVAVISALLETGDPEEGIRRFREAVGQGDPDRLLALVGFMGSGKTAVGRVLARRLGRAFLDLDREVERRTGRHPAAWIREAGEEAFRRRELQVLEEVLEDAEQQALRGGPPPVLACGGGTFVPARARELLRRRALCLWLDVPLETVLERIRREARGRSGTGLPEDRPLLAGGPERARALYRERRSLYAEAHLHVPADEASVEELARRVERLLAGAASTPSKS